MIEWELLGGFDGLEQNLIDSLCFSFSTEEDQSGRIDSCGDKNKNAVNLLAMSQSYEDMARHLDAHLAELDIESFRAEDINSILNLKSNLEFKSSSRMEEEEEELLFASPSAVVGDRYLSTDSLDKHGLQQAMEDSRMDVDGNELIDSIRVSTNCQANKENYTLAFKDHSYSGSSDSQTSNGSREEEESEGVRKVSWNKLGQSSLDSSGSFVGGWNMGRRSTPTKEAMQL